MPAMLPNDRTGAVGGAPAPDTLADEASGVASSLTNAPDIAPAYIAVVVSPYGQPRRRPYLSLHHAASAVARARGTRQQAWMLLCELRPVAADIDGEWSA